MVEMCRRAADVCVLVSERYGRNQVWMSDCCITFGHLSGSTIAYFANFSLEDYRYHHYIERDLVTGIMLPAVVNFCAEHRVCLNWLTFEGGVIACVYFDPPVVDFDLPWPRPKSQTHYWIETDDGIVPSA